jgi:hypothetical protein
MHRPFDGRGSQWRTAVGISIAIHIALLAFTRQVGWSTPTSELPPVPVVVWLSDWLPLQEEPIEPIVEDDVSTEEESVPAESESTITQPPDVTELSPGPAIPRQIIRRSSEWEEDARRAILRMGEDQERENNYMTFAFPFEPKEGLSSRDGDGRENSGQEPDKRHLMPERDSFGDQIISVGDGCYLTVGVGSILVEDSFRFSNFGGPTGFKCSRPVRVRDDLFADQKPAYLK